jgi:hypothetical protein
MARARRIFATRFGQLHLRTNDRSGVPLVEEEQRRQMPA